MQNLKTHLMPLQRQGLIALWSDADINAGEDWQTEIEKHLNTAGMILLLVSPDFIASDYCYSTEMAQAMVRHARQEARVVPIILRPTHWKGTPFAVIQALPKDARPITRWESEDDALYDVVERLEIVINELQAQELLTRVYQYYREKRYPEAIALCERIIQLKPDYASAHLGKGHALLLAKRYQECLASFDKAVELDPKLADIDLYVNKAIALEKLNQINESLVLYDQAINLCADSQYKASLYAKKGAMLFVAKRDAEALSMYQQAVILQPEVEEFYKRASNILRVYQPLQVAFVQRFRESSRSFPQLRLDVAQLTDIGRKCEHNQDNMAYVIPKDSQVMTRKGALFVVADGISGRAAGDVASEIAVDMVSKAYYQDESDYIPKSLLQAMRRANEAIRQRAAENILRRGMGTTCVTAVLIGRRAYIANVGDSRAYIIRGSSVRQITRDHSWVEEMVGAGLLSRQQARWHFQHDLATRGLGMQPDVQVDLFGADLEEGDTLILCTDGLWNLVNEKDLQRIVSLFTPQESIYYLIELANENGGPDNITAIVARAVQIQDRPPGDADLGKANTVGLYTGPVVGLPYKEPPLVLEPDQKKPVRSWTQPRRTWRPRPLEE